MKILVAGGGSGGHVNPALAMASSLKAQYPEADFLFVGSKHGLENDLVPKEGFRMKNIPVKGFSRKGGLSRIWPYMVLIAGMIKSFFIFLGYRPDMAIGTGGFASGPILFWTSLFKVPTLIHESNVLPGITNKMLSRKADIVAVCYPESKKHLPNAKRIEITGNPIRKRILSADRESARNELGLSENEKLVVIMGGSQGAKPINDAVLDMLKNHYKDGDFKLKFAPGKRHFVEVSSSVSAKFNDVEIPSYIYDSHIVYAAADLIVNRAGATTMSEITVLGLASVLVPSSYVAENHQEKNARMLEEKGACVVFTDSEINGETLYRTITELINDTGKLELMRKASASAGIRDASAKLLVLFKELLEGVE